MCILSRINPVNPYLTRLYKQLIIFVFSLLFHPLVQAQENYEEPPARLLTTLPFKMLSGGVVMITATLNDFPDSLNFVLDTGSGGISIDSLTALRLGLPLTPSNRQIRGIGGVRNVRFFQHGTLKMKGLRTDSLNFHISDYDILSSVYGMKVDGIIGFSFLHRYIVQLNYDSLQMRVYSRGKFAYKKGGHIMRPFLGTIPVTPLAFQDDRPMEAKFYFDTGAGLCLLFSTSFVNDSAIMRKDKPPMVMTQAEGLGGKTMMALTTTRKVRVGPYRFHRVPTFVFDDKYNVTSYPQLAGLIGNDLLRRFNVTINYAKKEIHLIPNSQFRDHFDYSYTGLGIYYVNNHIVVEDVVAGSPGDKSGFQVGDIILAVNNNFSNNIQQYKTLFQETGIRLKVLVVRGGKPVELVLKPRSILRKR